MGLTQIDFDEKQEEVIMKVRKKFKLNKPDAIKKMINSFYYEEESLL